MLIETDQDRNPLVSFGLPVRNAAQFIPTLLNSILSQNYNNIEIIVSDNHSDDNTLEILNKYASQDNRVRIFKNEKNIGQISNFNRVLDLSNGKYFRWIGADDSIEAEYIKKCVGMLEHDPKAIGVTTFQDFFDDDGQRYYIEYYGDRLDSPRAYHRFSRILYFLRADYRMIDPIYSFYNRNALMRTRRLQFVPRTDQVLSAEIVLMGRILHIPKRLCSRRRVPAYYENRAYLAERYAPERAKDVRDSVPRFLLALWRTIWQSPIDKKSRIACSMILARFSLFECYRALLIGLKRRTPHSLKRMLRPLRR